ncbi:sodium- and chloride-dependent glycine transporter 1 [Drosophila ficusphila]|uniref:sodium- and chloride-dependent glycine transporter 1 n=1 Tax=Drosophila ficusphila TaxID=30025 RepID=UPI0007E658BD|nr:sodium- and chloride-dependent glycine transporter 1 [Drosophila ficusphila]XP_017060349.1 sodium- and chloride-dependent glycine transporter 1 [Drosophila ficusphila]XP_017060351.1 sodium- and chloride-dependent glycine transporter 1 [Drosophila ficusphila]XP_017060352.1 sodium- and chloride-dependent glycine transporter 1 [Drosophila ficusphila]XP_017060353.1 sodium- and chloride-dependent glycine transporter 1 [Drosophila ficusphila]
MKGICGEQLNNCMLLGDCENSEHGAEPLGDFAEGGGQVESGSRRGGSLAFAARRVRNRQVHSMAVRSGSAYDTLERPYRHDKSRGRWAKSADFYFASCTHAFSSLIFSELSTFGILHGGWMLFIITYLMGMFFYSLPIFLIQAFLGQFSSSGSISAFRVAPIFKGIGYAILLLNLGTLTYYSIGAVVPLIYTVNSLHGVIPWMSCNNTWNTKECSLHDNYDVEAYFVDPHSTVEFFRSTIASTEEGSGPLSISWSMLVGVIAIWLVVQAILLKSVVFIGKALRCFCVLMFGFFLAVFSYSVIHEKVSFDTLKYYWMPQLDSFESLWATCRTALLMAGVALGPGWGSIITLSSYNNFRSDAEKLSIWVCLTHITFGLMGLLCCNIAHDNFEDHVGLIPLHVDEKHHMQFLYLCFSYLFGRFTTTPNLWAFLFFGMIFLSELCALIIQMMSVLTGLFDEFEALRSKRTLVICSLVLCLTASSVYFCTQLGFSQLTQLPNLAVFTQVLISGVLLLMTTWIYGRVRFQCDLQFMLGKTISSFKICFIRFVTPIFLGLCLFQLSYLLVRDHTHEVLIYVSQGLILLTAISYMGYKVCRTNGNWRQRLQQCLAPHDWHPMDADNRRFYEEIMGISEMLVIDANANTT